MTLTSNADEAEKKKNFPTRSNPGIISHSGGGGCRLNIDLSINTTVDFIKHVCLVENTSLIKYFITSVTH